MKFSITNGVSPEKVAQSFMFLAYKLCGGETGMGYLQARSDITIHNIFKFCGNWPTSYPNEIFEVRGDYVAGRMVKTRIRYCPDENWVEIDDKVPTPDYQGWCAGIPREPGVFRDFNPRQDKVSSYKELLDLAAAEVGASLIELEP